MQARPDACRFRQREQDGRPAEDRAPAGSGNRCDVVCAAGYEMVVRAEKQRARHGDCEKDSPRPSLPRQEQDSREKRRNDDDRHHVCVLPVRKANAKVRVRFAVHKGNRSVKRDRREREAG